ncbi:MAG: CHC2 zinc finger domain-containing protein [Saprospiraceae bacterium]|nr:CHC2 zinc finger domain-containing protein [Saprospiraceae bacterium]
MTKFITPEQADQIKNKTDLVDVISDYLQLQKKGNDHVGDCPCCGAKNKFSINEKKNIWKCWVCDVSGKGAISFLINTQQKTYPEALHILADKYNFYVEEKTPSTKGRGNRKESFRKSQLIASGISDNYQKYKIQKEESTYELDRYQSATKDNKWNILPEGDDMILHYLDLNGNVMKYTDDKGKQRPLLRVRWNNPSLHLNKDGKPIKYQSPSKSGSHLWIPNWMINAYKKHDIIETLYITEGEKKADKMCIEGMPTVGIMGIHNFSTSGDMPYQFELLIKRCAVANAVFVLDSDWQDISISNPAKSIESRPASFFKAVSKYRDYFKAYYNEGIEIEIYMAHGKDPVHKGVDDLLVHELKGKEKELQKDFKEAMNSRDGEGKYVNVYKITTLSSYKLKEFWSLHSNPSFLQKHQPQLKALREFQFKGLTWNWNKDVGKFELSQQLLPTEKYWRKIYDGKDKEGDAKYKYQFDYTNILEFLKNRGFGLYEYGVEKFRFIKQDNKVLEETTAHKIQRYVLNYTREIDEKPVVELLLRGGDQYLGQKKLQNMYMLTPEFNRSDKACMYLYFKNGFWKITKDEIIQRPLSELPRHIWSNKIIDFEPEYLGKPMASIERDGDDLKVELTEEAHKSHIAQFYLNSSCFAWKKKQELIESEDGVKYWVEREQPEKQTEEEKQTCYQNLVAKMIAAGYVLHDYIDYGNAKAVVCMDGIESEVGSSHGGTGKSVWAKQFKHLVPQVTIDGKKKNLEDDNHIYENVDERTQVILFDDVRVNFNFEFLFSHITTGITVNEKGVKRYNLEPRKFIITTNHALNGEGNSYRRRQYYISFSDYYNGHRSLSDEFGCQLFHEWEHEQWNLFYNWIATCIQTYLRFGLEFKIDKGDVDRRKLRQKISENFLDWAGLFYNIEEQGAFLNNKVEKDYACNKFLESYPQEKRFMNPRKFKQKLQMYAEYIGLEFNPGVTTKDRRIKSNSKEYLVLGNKDYEETQASIINSDIDLDLSSKKLPY